MIEYALYKQLGFVECSRRFVGVEQLEVVELVAERSNSCFSERVGRLSGAVKKTCKRKSTSKVSSYTSDMFKGRDRRATQAER